MLPQACSDREAIVTLTEGTRLEGKLLLVTPTSFAMEVRKTSNKREVAAGVHALERHRFHELRVRERRIAGRIVGTVAGFSLAGSAVLSVGDVDVAKALALPVYAGLITAGHFAGRAIDKRTRLVIVVDDPAAPDHGVTGTGPAMDDAGQ